MPDDSFNENPTSYVVSMHFSALFGGLVVLLGIVCALYRAPGVFSPLYRILNVIHLVFGFLFHVAYCGGSTPVVMLPVHGGYTLGFLSFYHLYVGYQLVISTTLIFVTAATMIPLFFYRMTLLLRRQHIFNLLFLRICIFTGAVAFPATVTPVLILATVYQSDQRLLKQEAVQRYGYFSRRLNLTENDLIIIDNRTIPCRITLLVGLAGLIGLLILTVSYTNIIFYVLKQQKDLIADATRKVHSKCTMALVYQLFTPLGVILLAVGVGTFLFWTGSRRADLMNVCAMIVGLAIPLENAIMLATFSPYRTFVLQALFLFRPSPPSPPNSTPTGEEAEEELPPSEIH